jgi:hypothetical protein
VLEGSAVDLENDEQVQRIYLGIGSVDGTVAPALAPDRSRPEVRPPRQAIFGSRRSVSRAHLDGGVFSSAA